jgi:hypothetical protein
MGKGKEAQLVNIVCEEFKIHSQLVWPWMTIFSLVCDELNIRGSLFLLFPAGEP